MFIYFYILLLLFRDILEFNQHCFAVDVQLVASNFILSNLLTMVR